ncbi:hypothetical protein EDF83_2445 [Pseudomonas protegens]|nr:hypothetical protein [Pseudomonas sp. BIGb0176]ROQ58111.1 hypothetical protein EDF83_2445 [Pseudomonas protegens]ROQ86021.1 hypothetical protein EC837_2933 [Pseudomonas protegens]
MHTTASLHAHPAAATPLRIFEIRRLAQEFGCIFVPSKPKPKRYAAPPPVYPNGGGNAA